MKKLFFLFALILSTTAFCKLEITVDLPATEFLTGLQLDGVIKVKFTNTGAMPIKTVYPVCNYNWNYFIEMKSDKGIPPYMKVSGYPLVMSEKDIHVLKPGETAECGFESYVFILPGEYHFRLVFDPAKSLALSPEYSTGLYAERVESEWKTIKIIQPVGQDKEIFDKYFSKEHMFMQDWLKGEDNKTRDDILTKYPSSGYAIWLFAGGSADGSPLEGRVKALFDYMNTSKTLDLLDKGIQAAGKKRIGEIREMLALHPDYYTSDWMRYEIVYWQLYRCEYEAAYSEAKGIVEKYKGKRSAMKAQEIMDFLLQKGLVKKN